MNFTIIYKHNELASDVLFSEAAYQNLSAKGAFLEADKTLRQSKSKLYLIAVIDQHRTVGIINQERRNRFAIMLQGCANDHGLYVNPEWQNYGVGNPDESTSPGPRKPIPAMPAEVWQKPIPYGEETPDQIRARWEAIKAACGATR